MYRDMGDGTAEEPQAVAEKPRNVNQFTSHSPMILSRMLPQERRLSMEIQFDHLVSYDDEITASTFAIFHRANESMWGTQDGLIAMELLSRYVDKVCSPTERGQNQVRYSSSLSRVIESPEFSADTDGEAPAVIAGSSSHENVSVKSKVTGAEATVTNPSAKADRMVAPAGDTSGPAIAAPLVEATQLPEAGETLSSVSLEKACIERMDPAPYSKYIRLNLENLKKESTMFSGLESPQMHSHADESPDGISTYLPELLNNTETASMNIKRTKSLETTLPGDNIIAQTSPGITITAEENTHSFSSPAVNASTRKITVRNQSRPRPYQKQLSDFCTRPKSSPSRLARPDANLNKADNYLLNRRRIQLKGNKLHQPVVHIDISHVNNTDESGPQGVVSQRSPMLDVLNVGPYGQLRVHRAGKVTSDKRLRLPRTLPSSPKSAGSSRRSSASSSVSEMSIQGRRHCRRLLIDSPDKIPPIRIFRRVARLVRLLCSVCIALKSYAIGKGLLDDYLVLISHRRNMGEGEEGGVEELTFNLKDFKIKKELEVPEATVNVLIKRPEDRTPEDITTIARLMRRLPSFRKYTREMQQLFCKIVRYMKCQQNRVVLRKGHIGYSLYFIYTGACSVVLDKDDTNIFIKKEVIILRKGACFGEIALVQNTRRNSTVVCTEDTEFLVVDKHLFLENGLNLQMEQEFTFRYNIFRRLPMMSHWSSNMVHELSNVSRTEEFVYNKVIVSDSTLNDWLWFVIKGSCDIIRLVELEKCPSFQHLVEGSPTPLANNHISLEDLAAATRRSLVKPTQSAKVELTEDEVKEEEVKEPEKPKRSSKWGVLSGGMFGALIDDGSTNKVETDSNSLEDISEIDTVLEAIKSVNHLDDIALKVINSAKAKEEKKTDNARQEEPKDVGYGLFFKVDTLRDGQCFGLDMIKEDKPINTRSFALISRGCEVIHVPKTRFREIADEETIRKATKLCKEYPADDILCERFIHRCRWNSYKYGVVEDVMTHRVRSGSVQSINSVQTPSNEHLMPKPTTQDELEAADIREAMRYKDEMSPSTDGLGQNHRRPHTSYGLCGRKAKAKQKADAKASWEMNLDLMRSTGRSSGSRDRPHTCPPSVSRSLIASMSSKGHKKKPSPPAGLEIEKVLKSEKIDADGESPLPKGESPIPKAGSIAPASKWCKMGGIKSYFKGPPRSVQIMADLEAGAVED